MDIQTDFAMKKGGRDSDRLCTHWLEKIVHYLDGKSFTVSGRKCMVRRVGQVSIKEDGTISVMFNIENPSDELDHIEFSIAKTGWGMKLNQSKTQSSEDK